MKFNTNLFQGVARKNVQKSLQDLSYEWKHDMNPGDLIPHLMLPVLPGDNVDIGCNYYFKFNPLYYPVIHRFAFHADLFYCPYRILWPAVVGDTETGWTNWIQLKNEVTPPQIDVNMRYYPSGVRNDSVMGYFGVPYLFYDTGAPGDYSETITGLNAFPAMAYLHIWDEYFRNTQLEEPRAFPLVAGDNTEAMTAAYGFTTPTDVRLSVLPAKWEKDYFTSMLPRPQLGDPVRIPMIDTSSLPLGEQIVRDITTGDPIDVSSLGTDALGVLNDNVGAEKVAIDMTNSAATIRQFTLATVVQGFRETLMRIKQTYRSYIQNIFDQDPQPLEIDIPVLFGSYSGSIMVSEVMTQATIDQTTPGAQTGQYAGNMGMYEQGGRHRILCKEHGVILGIMSIVPNTSYGQGINRYWRYSNQYDYPMDIFCGVGDQEVLNEELYYTNFVAEATKNQRVLGYIPKYSEARTIPNNFGSGLSPADQSGIGLSVHAGRWANPAIMDGTFYDDQMVLDEYFVNCLKTGGTADTQPQFALRMAHLWRTLTFPTGAGSQTNVIGYVLNDIKVERALPMYSTPGAGM